MTYQITYQPFLNRILNQSGTQRITVDLNEENLAGFILMARQVVSSNRINIRGNSNFNTSKYIGKRKEKMPYWGKFVSQDVRFNTLHGFQGAIFLCNLFGLSWQEKIKSVHQGNREIQLTSSTYLGRILLHRSGEMIDVRELPKSGINLVTTNAIIRNHQDCFGSYPGYHQPSNIYTSSLDPFHRDIVSSVAISPKTVSLPPKYQNGFYIYNACTFSPYQGKGLMKSLFIMMINQVLEENRDAKFYLKVDINNDVAIKLYKGLGFQTVDIVPEKKGSHYIMKFG